MTANSVISWNLLAIQTLSLNFDLDPMQARYEVFYCPEQDIQKFTNKKGWREARRGQLATSR